MIFLAIYIVGVLVNIGIYEIWGKSDEKSYLGFIVDLFLFPFWMMIFMLSWIGTLILAIHKVTLWYEDRRDNKRN